MKARIKSFIEEEFDRWELILYIGILPAAFALSILIGYILGTIF